MPATQQTTGHTFERAVSEARANLDYAVTQLVLDRFPGGIVNPYEGPIAGRVCLQWEGPGRSLETVITNGYDVWISALLPEQDADTLVNAALDPDPQRYESPSTPSGRTGSITNAYPGHIHFMDHEDGTPAAHHALRLGDGTARVSLERVPLDRTLLALTTLHTWLTSTRLPATAR
ncbi:hypothetical protein ACPC54_30565 [Kitasatospora sp. NPDC094028]